MINWKKTKSQPQKLVTQLLQLMTTDGTGEQYCLPILYAPQVEAT